MIRLRYCSIEFTPEGCRTIFEDGAMMYATPHPEMPHYSVIAHRCGYQDNLLAYTREHDFAHSFLADRLAAKPSAVLWAKAHGNEPSYDEEVMEEIAAQVFQRWLRANERADCRQRELGWAEGERAEPAE